MSITTDILNLCLKIFLLEICSYGLNVRADANKTFLCYFDSTAVDRPGMGRYTVNDIDPSLCTHVVYSKLTLDIEKNKITFYSPFLNEDTGQKKFTELKVKKPEIKLLINLQSDPYFWNTIHLELMINSRHVEAMAKNVVTFLHRYKIDGISLGFYPYKNKEKIGFKNLIEAMNKAFLPFGYILVVFGSSYESRIEVGYDFESLSSNVDFLILDPYDFHTPGKEPDRADHHAPLYKRPWDKENYNADFAVSHWISKGFPPEKILMYIPIWGRSWTLSSDDFTPPAPAKGPGQPGIYTKNDDWMGYFEICDAVVNKGWQVFQDPEKLMGPYAVSPDKENKTWVGYDDPDMAVIKSKYILSKGLGGAAVWELSLDDFGNRCGCGRNPMLTVIQKTLSADKLNDVMLSSNITLNNITPADIENLFYRQKVALIFSLFVSSCSFITIIYMLQWLYNLQIVPKHKFTDSTCMPEYDDCVEITSLQRM